MVPMATIAKRYKEKEFMSSRPEEIVLKLYDGAIRFLTLAIDNIKKDDIPAKARLVDKAVNIVSYLHGCLDMEKGGEIAKNLDRLYEFLLARMVDGNIKSDVGKIEESIGILRQIRDGWRGICAPDIKKGLNDTEMSNSRETNGTLQVQMSGSEKEETFSAMA
ncbi:MAG: flagellar export chaperone FliS [Candidatus Anammoxibacter sp.]